MPSLRPIFCSSLTIACCPLSLPRVAAYAPQRQGAPGVAALSVESSRGTARLAPAAGAVFKKSRLSTVPPRPRGQLWVRIRNGSMKIERDRRHRASTVYIKYLSSRLRGVNERHVAPADGLSGRAQIPLGNNGTWGV